MKKFWAIKNEESNETAELLLYGTIADETWYGDEITPKEFATELKELCGKNLTVRVNSPGGDVFAAQAIYNQLISYKGEVNIVIDGMCASAATLIACAGKCEMPTNAIYMIHDPSTGLMGYYNESELEKFSESLKAVKQTIVNVYMAKVGNKLTEVKLRRMMKKESWFTAEEAKKYGFVDEVTAEKVEVEDKGGKIFINSVEIETKMFQKPKSLREIINRKVATKMGEKEMDFNAMSDEELGQLARLLLKGEVAAGDNQNTSEAGTKREAVQAERQRIAALDELMTKNEVINAYIKMAKQNDITVEEATKYVEEMKKADKQKQTTPATAAGFSEAIKMIRDQMTSGAEGVQTQGQNQTLEEKKQAAKNEQIKLVAQYMNERLTGNGK